MFRAIRLELYKLFADKKLLILCGLLSGFTVMLIFAIKAVGSDLGGLLPKLANGQSFPALALSLAIKDLTPVLVIIIASGMICEEESAGTLKLALMRPVSRGEFLFAKITAVGVAILTLLATALITGFVGGALILGWGESMKVFSAEYQTITGILHTVAAYFITFFPYLAVGVFVLLLSLILPTSGIVIGVSLAVHLALSIAGFLVSKIDPYLVNNYYALGLRVFGQNDNAYVLMGIKVIAAYILVFSALNYIILKRMDITT